MDSTQRLYRHELGHAIAGVQLSASAIIRTDAHGMRTDLTWPEGEVSELAVCITWIGGILAEPSCMSDNDRFILAMMPRELREKAEHFVRTYTLPAIDALDPKMIDNMIDDLIWRGEVSIDADGDAIGKGLPS